MGVLNCTPDSFSDGGRYATVDTGLRRAQQMVDQGAQIIDVGGESSRPGAEPVSASEELERVVPIIEAIAQTSDVVISVDSTKPAVMRAACQAGAGLINDINALREEHAVEAALACGAAVCLMHMQGQPRNMQVQPHYADVVTQVSEFLVDRTNACVAAGMDRRSLLLDPGFGFGKSLHHNLQLLAGIRRVVDLGLPVLVGLSRKSMFEKLLGLGVDERGPAGLSAALWAATHGVSVIRTHDVAETVQAMAVLNAIHNVGGDA